MVNTYKVTKVDLIAIILCLEKANTFDDSDSKEINELKNILPGVICLLLNQCFGSYNTELIWSYAIHPEESKFKSIDELYDYISDPYSFLVNTDNALSLKELLKLYPQDEMFKMFKEYILQISDQAS